MLIETQDSIHVRYEVCARVASLKPGENIQISRHTIRRITSFWHKGAQFTGADRVLENIMGSAYTHDYIETFNGDIVFRRYADTGKRYYVSPDRRGMKNEELIE